MVETREILRFQLFFLIFLFRGNTTTVNIPGGAVDDDRAVSADDDDSSHPSTLWVLSPHFVTGHLILSPTSRQRKGHTTCPLSRSQRTVLVLIRYSQDPALFLV